MMAENGFHEGTHSLTKMKVSHSHHGRHWFVNTAIANLKVIYQNNEAEKNVLTAIPCFKER